MPREPKGICQWSVNKLAFRCFEWVIACWADLADSAGLRLLKVEAG
jgi:hypothetical protein